MADKQTDPVKKLAAAVRTEGAKNVPEKDKLQAIGEKFTAAAMYQSSVLETDDAVIIIYPKDTNIPKVG